MARGEWAVQAPNTPAISQQNQEISQAGAEKSAEDRPDSLAATGDADFGEALKMIALLPLSDAEKAEAVRRLLAGRKAGK